MDKEKSDALVKEFAELLLRYDFDAGVLIIPDSESLHLFPTAEVNSEFTNFVYGAADTILKLGLCPSCGTVHDSSEEETVH